MKGMDSIKAQHYWRTATEEDAQDSAVEGD